MGDQQRMGGLYFSSSLLLSSLELSDKKVYEPSLRALLGTASQVAVPDEYGGSAEDGGSAPHGLLAVGRQHPLLSVY